MTDNKGTILVVDDEPDSLALIVGILAGEGYQVRPADSGKLALESASAAPPDLILLDIRMPGMDGLEVCRWLKAQEETREIPVMFLSASTEIPVGRCPFTVRQQPFSLLQTARPLF